MSALVYQRMRLADHIVSRALQTNNACLNNLATTGAAAHEADRHLLLGETDRLLSLWQLMKPFVDEDQCRQARGKLKQAHRDLCGPERLIRQFALDLAGELTDERLARDLLSVARQMPPRSDAQGGRQSVVSVRSSDLHLTYQQDSASWRNLKEFGQTADVQLIRLGIVGCYKKGRGLFNSWKTIRNCEPDLRQLLRRVCRLRHQLELLGSVLSDDNKSRRWYLARLGVALEHLLNLVGLRRVVKASALPAAARRRARKELGARRKRLEIRILALGERIYRVKPRKFGTMVLEDCSRLGLDEIIRLPTDDSVLPSNAIKKT